MLLKENKWGMIITKKGQKIIDFKCFHDRCWREFWGITAIKKPTNLNKTII